MNTASKYAEWKAQVEPELAAKRLAPPAEDEPGCFLNRHRQLGRPPQKRHAPKKRKTKYT